MSNPLTGAQARAAAAVGWQAPADHRWTQDIVRHPLRDSTVDAITNRVLKELQADHVLLPNAGELVRRCVLALLVGHLVLQGPPGTGKTTLARALGKGFDVVLDESTATSDWTPYQVVGGLRPANDGKLQAAYGKVAAAALHCAEVVRASVGVSGTDSGSPQGAWLLIDEFNRADIDKAIGSLFTVLSSCDPAHLTKTPIDVWFEAEAAGRSLWVPARFRIIASMNDLDTSFVNRISQGLSRRFQFITVGPPTTRSSPGAVSEELEAAFRGAYAWLGRTYSSLSEGTIEAARSNAEPYLEKLQQIVDDLRVPTSGVGWPLGTAQIVDVLRAVLLTNSSLDRPDLWNAVDHAIADRVVPQMAEVDDDQAKGISLIFEHHDLSTAAEELRHLINPHEVL